MKAKKRLAALHQPIPRPTKAAVAQNRAEEDSRKEANTLDRLMSVVKKGPDVEHAAKVGEPTLVDPTPVAASGVVTAAARAAIGGPSAGTEHGLTVETVPGGGLSPSDAAPRSDTPAQPTAEADPFARPSAATAADPNELKPAAPDANELKPATAPDPNELTPAAGAQGSNAPLPPPVQVNEIQTGQASSSSTATADSSSSLASDQDIFQQQEKRKRRD